MYKLSDYNKVSTTLKFICEWYNYYLRHNSPAVLSLIAEVVSFNSCRKAYNDFMKTANYANEQINKIGNEKFIAELLDNGNMLGNIFFSADILYEYKEEWKKM